MMQILPKPSDLAKFWALDNTMVFLNHGSFGACTQFVLEKQSHYRRQLESQPVRFFMREMEEIFENSRIKLARFINSQPQDLVFVQNATAGVNTVFRSQQFNPGDEILFTNHIYGACRRTLEYVSEVTGASLVEAMFDFPVSYPDQIIEAILDKVTPRTRIVLIDHVSSATALVHPVEVIVKELNDRGIDTMVDGAHALGSLPLDLEKIGAAYYTANCHKWLCAPKSAAILHVRRDKQKEIVPLIVSHAGHRAVPFTERFFWPGTFDPTPCFCAADSLDYLESVFPGGWTALMESNHLLCLEARDLICNTLEIEPPCPGSMIASMASFPLPVSENPLKTDNKNCDPLQEKLFSKYHIEAPVWDWTSPPTRIIRIAVQLYNSMDQFRYFATALKESLQYPSY